MREFLERVESRIGKHRRQAGVRAVILLEGVNDIGYSATADEIISAEQQIATQAHARGLRVYGATITPFGGSFLFSATSEKDQDRGQHLDQDQPYLRWRH